MNLLAIDASTELSSVAVLAGDALYAEDLSSQKTHAQLLLPLIDRLMQQAQLELADLDGIIFGCGPGSFTGLRIACSIAKGLAYAHQLPLIPVSCLGAIAQSAREQYPNMPVLAVLDARMNELYWSYFPPEALIAEDKLNAAADILVALASELVLAGVGIEEYWPSLPADLQAMIKVKLPLYPNAAAMIRLMQNAAIAPVPIGDAQPIYVRNQVTQGDTRG